MVSLITAKKAQAKLANNARARRLQLELTQQGLAERSGVPLSTLRKFEQRGAISLESYLKLYLVLGGLDDIIKASEPQAPAFNSIDDVLSANTLPRGNRK